MVKVPVSVDHKQRELCGSVPGDQMHHGLRQWHVIRICNVAGVDQKRLRRPKQEVQERRLERGAKIFPKDECRLVIGVHLNGRLRAGRAVLGPFIPINVH